MYLWEHSNTKKLFIQPPLWRGFFIGNGGGVGARDRGSAPDPGIFENRPKRSAVPGAKTLRRTKEPPRVGGALAGGVQGVIRIGVPSRTMA